MAGEEPDRTQLSAPQCPTLAPSGAMIDKSLKGGPRILCTSFYINIHVEIFVREREVQIQVVHDINNQPGNQSSTTVRLTVSI